jgi:recombination protein RecT
MATNLTDLKQTKAVAERKPSTIFDLLSNPKVERGIKAVATQFLTPDRFLRMAINAVKKTPLLLQCDPQTVLGSFMTSAALGLEPNTIQQQAWLIPYKKRGKINGEWVDVYECQFQVGARGFVTLAHRSPHIDSLQAETIHEHDVFDHMIGSESFLRYKKALRNRGDAIGAFAYTKLKSGIEMATVLPFEELIKIRSKSETYKALSAAVDAAGNERDRLKAETKLAETPWEMWFDDMGAKSAIKKSAKQLPLNPGDAIASAVVLDQDSADSVIDMAAMAEADVARAVIAGEAEAPEHIDVPSNETFGTRASNATTSETVSTKTAESGSGTASSEASQQSKGGIPTEAELEERLNSASTVEELDGVRELINEIPDPDAETRLVGIFTQLRKKFERANQRAARGSTRPSAE